MNLTEHFFYLFLIASTFQVLLARNHRLKKYRSIGRTTYDEEYFENAEKEIFESELKVVDDVAYILIKAHKKGGDDIYHGAVYDLFEGYYMWNQKKRQLAEKLAEDNDSFRPSADKENDLYHKKIVRLLDRLFEADIGVDIKIDYQYGVQVKKRSSRNRRRQKNVKVYLHRHEGDEFKRVDAVASIIADAYHSDDEKINPDAVRHLFECYYRYIQSKWMDHRDALESGILPEDIRETFIERMDKYHEMIERYLEKLQEENVDLHVVNVIAY